MSAKTPILIVAMNRKGGIGKTTLVRALTSAIAHAGKSGSVSIFAVHNRPYSPAPYNP